MSASSTRSWNSAIYRGTVQHRRLRPKPHQFRYSMCMLYLDLDELPELFDQSPWYSARPRSADKLAVARFQREDHLGDDSLSLGDCVRELVRRETGNRPSGPIRLLTQLRWLGYAFNPVSFYYCFNPNDNVLETVVAEVNNTPWGEQYCYVLGAASDIGKSGAHRWQHAKRMHVSPFMPMDMHYDFRLSEPGEMLTVYMQNHHSGELVFEAGLTLQRQMISARSLRSAALRYPFSSLQVISAIHWQALRLWLKGTPVFTHPAKADAKGQRRAA